jgi:hypothetical protein
LAKPGFFAEFCERGSDVKARLSVDTVKVGRKGDNLVSPYLVFAMVFSFGSCVV